MEDKQVLSYTVGSFYRKSIFLVKIVGVIILGFVSRIIYANRSIILISERGTDARDNGYHMFKYLREKHPDIECYYVITSNSPDVDKVRVLGGVVTYKTLKHYMLFWAAKIKISTHLMGASPDPYLFNKLNSYKYLPGKLVFLQHGIIKDNIPSLYYENTKLDLFVCGAKPEYDYVCQFFHYPPHKIKYTGLARFDNLQNKKSKRQILVMPTWRKFLSGMSQSDFEDTEYYKYWNSFLQNDRLIKELESNDLQLYFYPHYEMQPYLQHFVSKSDNIIIADIKKYDVQALLIDSALLITDYSSVYFDFAYMSKPCVYYQFDSDRFFLEHYSKGYFDYEQMGFGEVVCTEKELIDTVYNYIDIEFLMREKYLKRADAFFPLRDNHNCERIYKEIMNME